MVRQKVDKNRSPPIVGKSANEHLCRSSVGSSHAAGGIGGSTDPVSVGSSHADQKSEETLGVVPEQMHVIITSAFNGVVVQIVKKDECVKLDWAVVDGKWVKVWPKVVHEAAVKLRELSTWASKLTLVMGANSAIFDLKSDYDKFCGEMVMFLSSGDTPPLVLTGNELTWWVDPSVHRCISGIGRESLHRSLSFQRAHRSV